ncbi:unnamed protein product [Closterium sp. Yama58-4]|nr:unnamed protein product [Closterium sp. Yama58-4]
MASRGYCVQPPLLAAANGEKTVVLSKSTIVLRAMEEVTQDGRRIHIQMVPQFGIENMKQLTTSVGVFIWMKVLADLSDAYIKAAIENTVKRTHSLESIKTRHSFTKDTSLVNKFAKTLAELSLRDARHVLGKIFQLFRPGTLGKVELVFHGTPSRNIKSIMTNGMDPSCRKSSPLGDWFSKSLTMPLQIAIYGDA